MRKFSYTIQDSIGIHARPAGLLAKTAKEFTSDITIETQNNKSADAKHLFSLMSLGVSKDDTVTITIKGDDEEQAENALKNFLKENL